MTKLWPALRTSLADNSSLATTPVNYACFKLTFHKEEQDWWSYVTNNFIFIFCWFNVVSKSLEYFSKSWGVRLCTPRSCLLSHSHSSFLPLFSLTNNNIEQCYNKSSREPMYPMLYTAALDGPRASYVAASCYQILDGGVASSFNRITPNFWVQEASIAELFQKLLGDLLCNTSRSVYGCYRGLVFVDILSCRLKCDWWWVEHIIGDSCMLCYLCHVGQRSILSNWSLYPLLAP